MALQVVLCPSGKFGTGGNEEGRPSGDLQLQSEPSDGADCAFLEVQ